MSKLGVIIALSSATLQGMLLPGAGQTAGKKDGADGRAQYKIIIGDNIPVTSRRPFLCTLAAWRDLSGHGPILVAVGNPYEKKPAVTVIELKAGQAIVSATGEEDSRFGASLLAVGDITGDGVTELAIGAPGAEFSRGVVSILDGHDGRELHRWLGSNPGDAYGTALALTDVAGESGSVLPAMVIGAPCFGESHAGYIEVRRLWDGANLGSCQGLPGESFGFCLAVDRTPTSGGADIVVGAPGALNTHDLSEQDGAVYVVDGSTFLSRRRIDGGIGFGWSVCIARSFFTGGAETSCVVVGEVNLNSGKVIVLGGDDYAILRAIPCPDASDTCFNAKFGWKLANVGDCDGDGWDDVLVSAPQADSEESPDCGALTLVSVLKGTVLTQSFGQEPFFQIGWNLCMLPERAGSARKQVAVSGKSAVTTVTIARSE